MEWGRQELSNGAELPRHRHGEGHLTIVLSGSYLEAGDEGRWRAEAGDMLFHHPYSAHLNQITRTAVVLNLPLHDPAPSRSWGRCGDPDAVVRLARSDIAQASELALAHFEPAEAELRDWPDALAALLATDQTACVGDWALNAGLSQEHVSRGFKLCFGATPKRFRAECRSRAAWRRIVSTSDPMTDIALALGYADQAHMSRAVQGLCGASPTVLRRCFQRGQRLIPTTA